MTEVRSIKKDDLQHLKVVIDSNELFPSDLLDGMIEDFFTIRRLLSKTKLPKCAIS